MEAAYLENLVGWRSLSHAQRQTVIDALHIARQRMAVDAKHVNSPSFRAQMIHSVEAFRYAILLLESLGGEELDGA